MARLARVVLPGLPRHVTQPSNGRARTVFGDGDCALYRDPPAESCAAARVEVWTWVLMPSHVHLILVPDDEDGLRRALAPTHRRNARHIHALETRSGRCRQGRFGSVAMDDDHLAAMSERQRKAARVGRPIGSTAFVANLETLSGRRSLPGKPRPKPKVHG